MQLERALILIMPFVSYMLTEAVKFSGVVAILFTGITMSHYTVRNLSKSTVHFSYNIFRVLAMLAESLVFIYIGAMAVQCAVTRRSFPVRS